MRRRFPSILLLSVVLGILGLAYGMLRAAEQGNKDAAQDNVIGTWKLVSARYGDQVIEGQKLEITLKHITSTSFVWLSYHAENQSGLADGRRDLHQQGRSIRRDPTVRIRRRLRHRTRQTAVLQP